MNAKGISSNNRMSIGKIRNGTRPETSCFVKDMTVKIKARITIIFIRWSSLWIGLSL